MSYFNGIQYTDSPNIDAYSRLRGSNPTPLFDAQFTYDLQPLQFDTIIVGTGSAVTYDSTNRCATLALTAALSGASALMQTFKYFNDNPGQSQIVTISFNMGGGLANTIKFAQYGDVNNAYKFMMNGTVPTFQVVSNTTNGTQSAVQTAWNLDKMNGSGVSGITLDFTKIQILVIDYQAFSGRVRFGFIINGIIYYAHQFLFTNLITNSAIQVSNMPISVGISCSASTITTSVNFISCGVLTEGNNIATRGFNFICPDKRVPLLSSGTVTHIASIQPMSTFNSIITRGDISKIIAQCSVATALAAAVKIELCLGYALTGSNSFTPVNSLYSIMEYNTAGTLSGSPAIILGRFYLQQDSTGNLEIDMLQYPITLDAGGADNLNSRISLIATAIDSTADLTGCIGYIENSLMDEKPEFKSIKEFIIYFFNNHLFQKSTFYGIAFGFLYLTNAQFRLHADELLGSSATVQAIIFYLIGKKG